MKSLKINSSELSSVRFEDAKLAINFKNQIVNKLLRATKIKSKGERPISIEFNSKNHGLLKVVHAVLMTGKDFVVLKGGQTIPISSIQSVTL